MTVITARAGCEPCGFMDSPLNVDAEIRQAMPLLKCCIAPYVRSGMLEMEDAMQTAIAGFIDGIRHYDASRGATLRTYAAYWIKEELQKAANEQLYLTVPLGLSREVIAMRKRGGIPKSGPNAHSADTLKKAAFAMDMAFRRSSPAETGDNDPDAPKRINDPLEMNPAFGADVPEANAGSASDYRKMRRLVDRIPSKIQRDCVYARFYLDRTLEEIAAETGISREAARQNIERGLCTMRAMLGMAVNDAEKVAAGKRAARKAPAC